MNTAYAAPTQPPETMQKELNAKIAVLNNTDKQIRLRLEKLQQDISQQQKQHRAELFQQQQIIEQLTLQQHTLEQDLSAALKQQTALSQAIQTLEKTTAQKNEQLNQSISQRTLFSIFALLLLLLLISAGYWHIRKRHHASEQTLSTQVQTVLSSVRQSEESIVKVDTELAERFNEFMVTLKKQQSAPSLVNKEPDHSLPLKLADEIHRMSKRLAALPVETKGLKPLSKSLERLQAELAEQGYEMIDYTGTTYSENMSVKARFVPSDELDVGQSVITKVVTPQVNFNDVMIRMADVEVSVG
ncbi:hypothetical protein [Alkanindiges illinoisensis]|uniref:Nucleotide exchange factor GrpE n=1 Tax=Alkanindiges illinoisensis TaxID=197183 RepID=A0A4Y7XG75_9GAMM|nr:hypothetical protein [Alkanindiges illinoisensis]TEU30861.1 hypothetical protein E2B99_00425 [Alkanindiges illinoisensis]